MADVLDLHVGESEVDDLDVDIRSTFPSGGTSCPVPACGPHVFKRYASLVKHWRKRHIASARLHQCPLCPKTHTRRCKVTSHLRSVHKVTLNKLREILLLLKADVVPNKMFMDPGSHRLPRHPGASIPVEHMEYEDALAFYGIPAIPPPPSDAA